GFVPGVNTLTGFDAVFKADDGTDYRLGAEYIFRLENGKIVAARAGVFTQADSTIRAVSTGTGSGVLATPASLPGRDREIHGALGLGIGVGRQQIDLAMDLGNSANEFLVSYIFKGK